SCGRSVPVACSTTLVCTQICQPPEYCTLACCWCCRFGRSMWCSVSHASALAPASGTDASACNHSAATECAPAMPKPDEKPLAIAAPIPSGDCNSRCCGGGTPQPTAAAPA